MCNKMKVEVIKRECGRGKGGMRELQLYIILHCKYSNLILPNVIYMVLAVYNGLFYVSLYLERQK